MTDFVLTTTAGDAVRDFYRKQGAAVEREYLIGRILGQVCFDAQNDADGRCSHHGGKCYELLQLIAVLKEGNK